MKKLLALFILLFAVAVPMFAAIADSTLANATGEIAGGLYNYYWPTWSPIIQKIAAGLVTFGVPLFLHFYANLKADPTKSTAGIPRWLKFIADTLTWFVVETSAPANSAAQPDDQKKN